MFFKHALEAVLNNIRVKPILTGCLSHGKVQYRTRKESPHNGVDSGDMYVVVTKYISGGSTDGAAYCGLFCSLFPEQSTNQWPEETAFQTAKGKQVQEEDDIRWIDGK